MCQKIVVMLKEDKGFCLVTEVVHKPLMASRQAKDVDVGARTVSATYGM